MTKAVQWSLQRFIVHPMISNKKEPRRSIKKDTDRDKAPHGNTPARVERVASDMPRHRAIYEELLAEIQTGVYKPGDRLPSEAVLCERFEASRITVAKAFQTLQRDNLVTRRPGSGTYVEKVAQESSHQFGVLIPDFGTTDIFEPICQGIMRSPAARSHSLTWGSSVADTNNKFEAAESLCQQYIAQRVSGVFFAPIEYSETRDESNRRLISMLERASIPVVLLDRDFEHYPDRSNFDLVGIDNHGAGYVLTRHLIQAGAHRIIFAMRRNSASTVEARAAGYREALYTLQHGAMPFVFANDHDDPDEVKAMLEREKPDGIVCANDITAAHLMRTMVELGVRIPSDIRMVGIDDVSYAKFLSTPLTTLFQNCAEIGAVAMATMLDRLSMPNHPVRDVLVRCELIVRASCGTNLEADG
jgi:GntR family transcriptional regulator of arabinose operon